MATSFDAGSVIARIKADLAEFKEGLNRAKKELNTFAEKASDSWDGLNDAVKKYEKGIKAVTVASTAVAATGLLMMRDWLRSTNDQVRVNKQLEAVLKSTNGVVGLTAQQIQDMASKYQKLTTIGDEAIQQGQNMLLTFTGIGKDAFEPATAALLDMATAMNGGLTPSAEQLTSQATQLGKALNDPIRGIAVLSRNGVVFTEQQAAMIEKLQKSGDLLGAQRIILDELAKEYGGSASAQLQTFNGRLTNLYNRFGDIKERLGTALIPMFEKLADVADRVLTVIEGLSPKTIETIATITAMTTAIAAAVAAFGGFLLILPKITAAFGVVKIAMLAINPVFAALVGAAVLAGGAIYKTVQGIRQAWDQTTDAIQSDVQRQSDTWNAWNNAAAQLAGNEQEYARLRAKAQYYILQSTLLTESQIAAIRAGASQDQLNAIQMNIDGNNKWAKEAANSAIEYAKTHTINMQIVNSSLSGGVKKYQEYTDAAGQSADASKKAAEEAAKDTQEQLKNRSKLLKDLLEFKKGADDALTTLREDHKETLKSMERDIDGLRERLTELKKSYDTDIADIQKSLAENLGKMKADLDKNILTVQVRVQKEKEQTQESANKSIAEKYVAQQEELARIQADIGKATTFSEKQRLEQEYTTKKAILDSDAKYVVGLESVIAEVKRYNSMSEIQRIAEDTAIKLAAIDATAKADIAAAQASYAEKVAIAKQEAKEAEERRTADYVANKLKLQKDLGEKIKSMDDEVFLFQEKEKALIEIRNNAVKIYADQISEMVRFTDRSVNAMIARYQALNQAIQNVGKAKNLNSLIGTSDINYGNIGRTPAFPDLKKLLSEIQLPSSIPKLANGGIVNRQTLAIIGESGSEAVVPLDRAGALGGVHIHVDGAIIGSVDAAVDLLDMAIRRVRPSLGV